MSASGGGGIRTHEGTRFAPQEVAEAEHGDACGNGEQPLVDLRQQGDREGDQCANDEECGSPSREDIRPEQRDPEDDAAGKEDEAADPDEGGQRTDVAVRVPPVAIARTSLT